MLTMMKKFWEQKSQEIKDLIHLRDHVEVCLVELKKLEVDIGRSENNLDPLLEKVKQANNKLNGISNEIL